MKTLATALSVALILLTGCHRTQKDHAFYARDSYQKRKHEREHGPRSRHVSQASSEDYLIDVAEGKDDPLEKLPWENVDDWIERIHSIMTMNHDTIQRLRMEADQLSSIERQSASEMALLVQRNESMRRMLDRSDPVATEFAKDSQPVFNLPPPTFDIHLIRKGDTLYSIAREHYGDPRMVRQIVLWNQGWIRNPDNLIAGLTIVLFKDNAPEKNEQVVEEYMRQIPRTYESIE